jgi:hypothetical protein
LSSRTADIGQPRKKKNQRAAFERSFNLGFGVETDLRDIAGKIVISHDMPQGTEMPFEELLRLMSGRNLPLALNIKADGLGEAIKRLLACYGHTNYFTFDMSLADLLAQSSQGLKVFTGLSDILRTPLLLKESFGVWLDCFYADWYDSDMIDNLIATGKIVCIVSSELHGRTTEKQWEIIRRCKSLKSPKLMLCTDIPEDARRYFYGKDKSRLV